LPINEDFIHLVVSVSSLSYLWWFQRILVWLPTTIAIIIHCRCHHRHHCSQLSPPLHCAPMSIALIVVLPPSARCCLIAIMVVNIDIIDAIVTTKAHKRPHCCQNKEAPMWIKPCHPVQLVLGVFGWTF
jgi:hypothetical protein